MPRRPRRPRGPAQIAALDARSTASMRATDRSTPVWRLRPEPWRDRRGAFQLTTNLRRAAPVAPGSRRHGRWPMAASRDAGRRFRQEGRRHGQCAVQRHVSPPPMAQRGRVWSTTLKRSGGGRPAAPELGFAPPPARHRRREVQRPMGAASPCACSWAAARHCLAGAAASPACPHTSLPDANPLPPPGLLERRLGRDAAPQRLPSSPAASDRATTASRIRCRRSAAGAREATLSLRARPPTMAAAAVPGRPRRRRAPRPAIEPAFGLYRGLRVRQLRASRPPPARPGRPPYGTYLNEQTRRA